MHTNSLGSMSKSFTYEKFTIDVENNSKLETTNTEFEATEEVKEGDDWKGGGEFAPGGVEELQEGYNC